MKNPRGLVRGKLWMIKSDREANGKQKTGILLGRPWRAPARPFPRGERPFRYEMRSPCLLPRRHVRPWRIDGLLGRRLLKAVKLPRKGERRRWWDIGRKMTQIVRRRQRHAGLRHPGLAAAQQSHTQARPKYPCAVAFRLHDLRPSRMRPTSAAVLRPRSHGPHIRQRW